MIERLFTQTYIGCQSTPPFWDFYTLLNPLQQVDHVWEEQGGRKGGATLQNSREVKSPISPHLEAQPSESGGQRVLIKTGGFPNNFPRWSEGGWSWWCSLGLCHRGVLETQRELSSPIGHQPHWWSPPAREEEKNQRIEPKIGVCKTQQELTSPVGDQPNSLMISIGKRRGKMPDIRRNKVKKYD